MATIRPHVLVDAGLGNAAYLLDLGDGRALVVDPSRDLRRLRGTAEKAGLRPVLVAETHLHADFVSGARQLQSDDAATVLASAAGDRAFGHTRLADGDEVDLGGLTLRALGTPGHTDEHLSYLLLDGSSPVGVFTGGSLLVSSAARTDLVSAERSEELARAQYRSIRRILELPDDTLVWPTHGAGSFCSAPPGTDRTSTIAREKTDNPLLAAADEDDFAARLLAGLGSHPVYFDRLGELNRRGPAVLNGAPALRALDPATVGVLLGAGGVIVDVRAVSAFGAGHIPGAISIPLRDQFATWLGWIVPAGTPTVIVRDPDQDPAEIAWQAAKIGHDLAGELHEGMSAWDGPPARIDVLDAERAAARLSSATVLDVRQDGEYAAGHVPGALSVELGALSSTAWPAGPTLTMCGHGERAMTAASLAARQGRSTAVFAGGPDDLAHAAGTSLVTGRR